MKKQLATCMTLIGMVSLFATSDAAYGQWYAGPRVYAGGVGVGYGGYGGYGYGGFGASDPVSSYTAAYTNGMANVIRSQGQYNQQTAAAMIDYEKARTQYLDNQQKYLATRQTIKRMAKADDQKQRIEANATMARAEEFQATHKPLPLAKSQLDNSGNIDWPAALKAKDFDGQRAALEQLFQKRAKYGATADTNSQIQKASGELKDSLREHILAIPLSEYSAARKFLDSMSASI